jgi:hypothetical protein
MKDAIPDSLGRMGIESFPLQEVSIGGLSGINR